MATERTLARPGTRAPIRLPGSPLRSSFAGKKPQTSQSPPRSGRGLGRSMRHDVRQVRENRGGHGRFTRAGAVVGALALAASLALTGCGGDEKKPEFVGGASSDASATPGSSRTFDAEHTERAAAHAEPGRRHEEPAGEHGDQREAPGRREGVRGHPDGGRRRLGRGQAAHRRLGLGAVRPAEVRHPLHGHGDGERVGRHEQPGHQQLHHDGQAEVDDRFRASTSSTTRRYGVAMPVVTEFHPGIPKKDRAAVQKRMFVQTDPPQPGAWHWVGNGTQAYYRAPGVLEAGHHDHRADRAGGHAAEQRQVRRHRPQGHRQDRPRRSR